MEFLSRSKYIIAPILLILFIFSFTQKLYPQTEKYRKAEKLYFEGDQSQFDYILNEYKKSLYRDKEAALVLGRMGNPKALATLSEALINNVPSSREALISLSMIKDKRCVPALIRVIREERDYADKAIEILGELKDKRALPILRYLVKNRKKYYIEAIDALRNIGDPESTDLILDILKKKPEKEPEKIYIKIEHPNLEENKIKRRERVINVSEPSAEIIDYTVTYDNYVKTFYKLSDFDFDTLDIITHYSINNGVRWYKATAKGKTQNITREEYKNSLLWYPKDDIEKFDTESILFRMVPVDDPLDLTRGFPAVINIPIDTSSLYLRDLPPTVNGEVELFVFNPISATGKKSDLTFHFSLDNGRTWSLATCEEGLPKNDTLKYYWQSERDLPGTDVENVVMRVSSAGNKKIGKIHITDKFHIDNNKPPSITINSLEIDEGNIVDIDYTISDVERDPVSLMVEYSIDKGISWIRATTSGNLNDILPDGYDGKIAWYYDFDISDTFSDSVRVKLTPFDSSIGFMAESRDFIIRQIGTITLAEGKRAGDILLQYKTEDDVKNQVAKYSIDGGKTWQKASYNMFEDEITPNQKYVKLNWEVDDDILNFRRELKHSINTLLSLKNPNVIRELIKILQSAKIERRSDREKSLAIKKIFNDKPKWVIDGMLNSLIDDDKSIREFSYSYLKKIPEPRVIAALNDYENYWNQREIYQSQLAAIQKEEKYQAWIAREIQPKPLDEGDLVDFIVKQGFSPLQAQKMLKSLNLHKEIKKLKKQYLDEEIDEKTYFEEKHKYEKELEDVKQKEEEKKFLDRLKKGLGKK